MKRKDLEALVFQTQSYREEYIRENKEKIDMKFSYEEKLKNSEKN